MPNWMITHINDIGTAEGRSVTKIVDFHPFCENLPPLPDPSNDDDNNSDFMPDLANFDNKNGITN